MNKPIRNFYDDPDAIEVPEPYASDPYGPAGPIEDRCCDE